MDETQLAVAKALRETKPDPYAAPVSFRQWQLMAHAINAAVHPLRVRGYDLVDTREFLVVAGMSNGEAT